MATDTITPSNIIATVNAMLDCWRDDLANTAKAAAPKAQAQATLDALGIDASIERLDPAAMIDLMRRLSEAAAAIAAALREDVGEGFRF